MPLSLIIAIILGLSAVYGITEILKGKRKKNNKISLAMAYDMLVLKNKLSIEQMDVIRNKLIALDRLNQKLVMIDQNEGSEEELCIPLQHIGSSGIMIERNDQHESIKRISLQLQHRRTGTQYSFCFYDDAHDPIIELPSLSKKAWHWSNRVNIHRQPGTVSTKRKYA
jgi:hypothetical protein